MSSFKELDATVEFLKLKNANFSILQCTTAYPTKPKEYGLNVIQEIKQRYNVTVGFSDHSAKIATNIAAVALGAEILEFHAVFDRKMFGPDAKSSLTIAEITELVSSVNDISIALKNPIDKNDNQSFSNLKAIFEKSLCINKNLNKNHILTFDDLESKKPKGFGIDAINFQQVIGKSIVKDLNQWDFLNLNDIN